MISYIYAIASSPDGPTKIGISVHPARRVRQLQTGRSDILTVYYQEPIPAEKAQLMERVIHRENRHLRLKGEWFEMPVEAAIQEIKHSMIRFESEVETLASIRRVDESR